MIKSDIEHLLYDGVGPSSWTCLLVSTQFWIGLLVFLIIELGESLLYPGYYHIIWCSVYASTFSKSVGCFINFSYRVIFLSWKPPFHLLCYICLFLFLLSLPIKSQHWHYLWDTRSRSILLPFFSVYFTWWILISFQALWSTSKSFFVYMAGDVDSVSHFKSLSKANF